MGEAVGFSFVRFFSDICLVREVADGPVWPVIGNRLRVGNTRLVGRRTTLLAGPCPGRNQWFGRSETVRINPAFVHFTGVVPLPATTALAAVALPRGWL